MSEELRPLDTKSSVKQSDDAGAVLGLSLATLFWASGFVVGKEALVTIDPTVLATARYGLAGVLMAFVLRIKGHAIIPGKRHIVSLTVASMLGVSVYNVIFFTALSLSTPLHGLCILAASPAVTILVRAVVSRSFPNKMQILGVTLSFTGVIITISQSISLEDEFGILSNDLLIGDLLFFTNAVLWALYSIFISRINGVSSFLVTAWSLTIGGFMLMIYSAIFADFPYGLSKARASDVMILVYMATFGTIIANGLWNSGVRRIGPSRAAVFVNLVPIWGSIVAIALVGTIPTVTNVVGIVFVIVGVCAVQNFRIFRKASE